MHDNSLCAETRNSTPYKTNTTGQNKEQLWFQSMNLTTINKLPRVCLALTGTLVTETPIKAQSEKGVYVNTAE